MRLSLITLAIITIFTACQSQTANKETNAPDNHQIVVKEVIQTSNYTYLRATENDKEIWLAVPLTQAEIGATYYYKGGMNMPNFESKELKKTFDNVIFLEGVSKTPITAENANNQSTTSHGSTGSDKQQVQKIEAAQGGITIAELYAKKDSYAGKTVKIKGQVTKFTEAVMNKNWIHIQDGTDNAGEFDLTVTTAITAKVGDIITVEGKITLDKDFGYGYKYKVLMEDAVQK